MLKKQNGITLIALIITVIVMLILVGVTINVALNGGLFEKAEYASEQMQIKAEEEELLSAIVAAIGTDGKIDFNYLDNNLPTRWSKVEEKTYKSPKDNIYEVDANGKITYKGKNTGGGNTPVAFTWASVNLGNVDTSAEYKGYIEPLDMTVIVSFTEDGRVLMHEGGETIEIDAKDEENIDEESGNLSFSLELIKGTTSNITVKMNGNNIDAEIQGLGTIPYVKQGKTIYSNEEVLKMLGITNFTGTYNGTWTVLESGADGNPIKLVSTSAVSNYTLGHDDPRAIEAISIVGTEPTSEEKLERSIWSYKNV
ncbi:MAG: type II secretion system protein, partial [Clostridia bacterium]|nr:type II secretion system protein [Clostridia bacterium]